MAVAEYRRKREGSVFPISFRIGETPLATIQCPGCGSLSDRHFTPLAVHVKMGSRKFINEHANQKECFRYQAKVLEDAGKLPKHPDDLRRFQAHVDSGREDVSMELSAEDYK